MKLFNKYTLLSLVTVVLMSSCNDFLDREPIDQVTPDTYLRTDADLGAYALKRYNFTTHAGAGLGIWAGDNHTDNQVTSSYSTRWIPGEWKVPDHYNDDSRDPWYFGDIYQCNYFLETVLPRFEAGTLTGNQQMVEHYIGEVFFLRAWNYFGKLKALGDFPIIKTTLPDQQGPLAEASKRAPRHLVARFILEDLDEALELLKDKPEGGKNRITRNAALLLKSRVALYEASWETYHANTAFVPNGPGYPGGQVEYNASAEIAFFLSECKTAAAEVADQDLLAVNDHVWADGAEKMSNEYFAQFGADDMETYSEILFWRDYDVNMNIIHSSTFYLRRGGNSGFSRQFVETFVMENGLPIYAAGSGYAGDTSLENVRDSRDERLQMFMMTPNEVLTEGQVDFVDTLSTLPNIIDKEETRAVTGYQLRKGLSNNWSRDWNENSEGSPIFRAAEAYLNYIEASCIENGGNSIDGKAAAYWNTIRERAGIDASYETTVGATDLNQESDWAVYSAGQQVSALMYNIRRERRVEFMQEGLRMDDLKRWRALDQVQNWMPEGFNLWESGIHEGYDKLVADGSDVANVSSPERSTYLRPYEIINKSANLMYGVGYNWTAAHYLNPISIVHFRNTAEDPADPSTSVIYQNPGWPTVADQGPIDIN
ncbi:MULTISPECIES: RagB/SusD family nutrient uptake outer membrane protein [unclassified Carboxylicivirga]|uniref:RagB/SusD family nutrient uptake outer membrane protein n=1 Tax=Carboxylicivirga TaxID=1628153 RepID=UPI003D32A928